MGGAGGKVAQNQKVTCEIAGMYMYQWRFIGAGETLLGVVSAYCYETDRRMDEENLRHLKQCRYFT